MYVPRVVRFNAAGKAVAVVAIVFAVSGLVIPTLANIDRERKAVLRAAIEQQGVMVEAVVTRTGKTGGEHPQRFADYSYLGGTGRVVLADRDRRSLAPGTTIAVRYLPAEPHRSWAVGYEPKGAPAIAMAAVGVCLWFGAAIMVLNLHRQRQLLAEGRAAMGRVIAVKRTKDSEGGANYRALYEIALLSGATRRIWAEGGKHFVEGAVVPVVYDPENPKRLSRYPMKLVTVARD
jgi:hypothetical protein